MRKKAAVYNSKPTLASVYSQNKPLEAPKAVFEKSDWRRKVNSPVVEEAIDHFTRHLVSEWVSDLWYSRITPDRQGPEELVQIINGVLAEISSRMRNVNLIDLLTRFSFGRFSIDVFPIMFVKSAFTINHLLGMMQGRSQTFLRTLGAFSHKSGKD